MKESQINISTKTLVRFWLVIIGFAVVLAGLWLAQSAVIIILVSFFLALVLNRPVSFFARHIPGKSRGLGVFISYIITIIIIAGALILVLPVFFEQSMIFINTLPDTINSLRENSDWITDFVNQYNLHTQYDDLIKNINDNVGHIGATLGSAAVGIVSGLANGILNFIFVLFITFFMLTEGPKWVDKFWDVMYKDEKRRKHHKLISKKMYDVISGFVSGQIAVAALSGVLAGVGALALSMIFGFPASIVLPTVAIVFISSFIPMFGGFIGGLISTAIIALYSPVGALVYVVYFLLYQLFLGNWLAPKIQGQKMNMSPLIVLVALTIGLQIGGIFGALISIPLAGCILVLLREYIIDRSVASSTVDIDAQDIKSERLKKRTIKSKKTIGRSK